MRPDVALLVGGRSTEHDASLASYDNLVAHLTEHRTVEVPFVAFVERDGTTSVVEGLPGTGEELRAGAEARRTTLTATVDRLASSGAHVFSLLHGNEGEDGAWQGLAEVHGIAGSFGSVRAAALTMDKAAFGAWAATLDGPFRAPVTIAIDTAAPDAGIARSLDVLGDSVCVLKPNSLGASLFVTHVARLTEDALREAVATVAPFDESLLVQEYVPGDELTVGVVERPDGLSVLPVARAQFASPILGHWEKHASGSDVGVAYLADDDPVAVELREASVQLFRALRMHLWCRFDFRLDARGGRLVLLEANAMPGLGVGSIFPSMLGRAGMRPSDLPLLSHQLVRAASASGRQKTYRYSIDVSTRHGADA